MGALTRLASPAIMANRPATDDFWYEPVGSLSLAGVRISPDAAFRTSAVYASVKVISETLGALPFLMYERQADGGKQRASDHPLYDILRYQPNSEQTAYEFWRLMAAVAMLYGTAYAEIKPGQRGFANELVPLPPHRTKRIMRNGRMAIRTYTDTGVPRTLLPDEVFMLPGLSIDGVTSLGIPDVARDAIGLAIASEQWGARFFSQSSQPGGILRHPGELGEEAMTRLTRSWQAARSGLNNAHKVVVLEEGMEYAKTTTDAEQAQLIETRKHQLADVTRYFRLPPHKIGIMDAATFSNIEEQSLEFVSDTIQPWAVAIEQRTRMQLILAKDRFFAEFLLDSLLRGRMKERAEVFSMYVTNGIMSENEVRLRENLNPIDGLDEPRRAENIGREALPQDTQERAVSPKAEQIALKFAERLVRREVTAVSDAARKTASDTQAFSGWLDEFYGKQAGILGEDLHMDVSAARAWCDAQKAEVLNFGASVLESWTQDKPAQLAAIAFGQEQQA